MTTMPAALTATVVVMGVSACGKSTIAYELVDRLGWAFAEGDDFHSDANVAKMHAGHALTDDDRWPWLRSIAAWIGAREQAGDNAIVTCSASVSYTHLRAHETRHDLVCRLLLA